LQWGPQLKSYTVSEEPESSGQFCSFSPAADMREPLLFETESSKDDQAQDGSHC
jgi:hypothetical protein